jgi:biopolymer transport protein ExbD
VKSLDDIATRLIERAARAAPEYCSERLNEEWLAHSLELPAATARLKFALGCCWAVTRIDRRGAGSTQVVSSAATGELTMTAHATPAIPLSSRETNSNATANLLCEINTTPLIDIMLVLLITLIVVLPVLTHAVQIELPQESPMVAPPPEVIDLDIESDGTVVWNGTAIQNMGQLQRDFRAEALKNPQPEIRLRPNPHVKYDAVAKVLALAQRNRLKKVGFLNTARFHD